MVCGNDVVARWELVMGVIDLANETVVSLKEAAKLVPGRKPGKRAHVSTLHRWALNGCDGIKLETLRLGGVLVTSVEALQRFAEECSRGEGASAGAVTIRTNRARQRAIAQAERELDAAGIN